MKMPHSNFKMRSNILHSGMSKCPCGQTFDFASERDREMKLRMHRKFRSKTVGSKQLMIPKKTITPQDRPFCNEFRVVGQFVVRAWIKMVSCRKQDINDRISLPGVAGCLGGVISPPVSPGQSPGGGSGGEAPEAPAILPYTVPKIPPKSHFLGTFLSVCCIQIERKNSFKLKKFMCKANNSTSCSVNISKRISCNTKAQIA